MLIAIACLVGFWLLLNVIAVVWTHWKGNKYWAMWDNAKYLGWKTIKTWRWRIKMRPYWLWWFFRNVKLMYYCMIDEEFPYALGQGENLAWGIIYWGKFFKQIYSGKGYTGLVLNYMHSQWPFSMIRDYVRLLPDGRVIGQFYIQIWGGKRLFLAWFTMEKIA